MVGEQWMRYVKATCCPFYPCHAAKPASQPHPTLVALIAQTSTAAMAMGCVCMVRVTALKASGARHAATGLYQEGAGRVEEGVGEGEGTACRPGEAW